MTRRLSRIALLVVLALPLLAMDCRTVDQCGHFAGAATTEEEPVLATPFQPTTVNCGPVTTLDNRPGPVTGTRGDDGGDDGDGSDGASGPASITAAGTNDDSAMIYRIGPGAAFARTGGDAATVWCRPDSDCNGEGRNRSSVNAAHPPASWVADSAAFFRRSGSMGTAVTFMVDGHGVARNF